MSTDQREGQGAALGQLRALLHHRPVDYAAVAALMVDEPSFDYAIALGGERLRRWLLVESMLEQPGDCWDKLHLLHGACPQLFARWEAHYKAGAQSLTRAQRALPIAQRLGQQMRAQASYDVDGAMRWGNPENITDPGVFWEDSRQRYNASIEADLRDWIAQAPLE